jgi:hypothetical protein
MVSRVSPARHSLFDGIMRSVYTDIRWLALTGGEAAMLHLDDSVQMIDRLTCTAEVEPATGGYTRMTVVGLSLPSDGKAANRLAAARRKCLVPRRMWWSCVT